MSFVVDQAACAHWRQVRLVHDSVHSPTQYSVIPRIDDEADEADEARNLPSYCQPAHPPLGPNLRL